MTQILNKKMLQEKTTQQTAAANANQMKERFEFVLTSNGNVVCQRYFRIHGFKHESESSLQLTGHGWETDKDGNKMYFEGALERCARMIHDDLAYKSRMYLWYSAPQTFQNEAEFEKWIAAQPFSIKVPSFVVMRENENVYVWDGENGQPYMLDGKPCEPFEARFNRNDYFENDDEQPVKLKLSFLDNGREVCSTEWSANIYPKFVRNNIDLSNSKNKYKNPEQFSIIEATLIDIMIANRQDLIPLIVREICQACSFENADDYATTLKYGNKTYNLNIYKENSKYFRSLENAYRAKTNRYFKSIQ
jgi:hypothetical protein